MSTHSFDPPLIPGRLLRRYKRFLADVQIDEGAASPSAGQTITAHCMNTGGMLGLTEPGSAVWLTPHDSPKRKLQWTWELASDGQALVGVNTQLPNSLVAASCAAGTLPTLPGQRGLAAYAAQRREVPYGVKSRIDILLHDHPDDPRDCYVEVKSVTLAEGAVALFPDAVSARGLKHLHELSAMVASGARAVMVYLVQRGDTDRFAPAEAIDPAYAAGLRVAVAAGVEVLSVACRVTPDAVAMERALPLVLAREPG